VEKGKLTLKSLSTKTLNGNDVMCRNRNCENFSKESSLHDYCDKCIGMANEVMSNARCVKTGNKPEFEQALRIAEYALRIYQNTYSAPEQLEWATMIYPSGWADLFEGVHEDKSCKTCDGSGTLFIANDDGSTAEVACPEKCWR